MSNIYTGKHEFEGYKSLAELTGLTFTTDTKYIIQIQNPVYIREGTNGSGFLVSDAQPFEWTKVEDELYIYSVFGKPLTINISK